MAAVTVSKEVPEIVSLPLQTVQQVLMTTPIQTESVTITLTTIETTTIPTTIPTTTLQPISQPYVYGDFTQEFDFDEIFSFPTHTAEASLSRDPDPRDASIITPESQVAGLLETVRKSREDSEAQQAKINSLLLEVTGERGKEKKKEKPKPSGDEACHPVDLTKDDDKDKDPEAGPSGGEQQALAIVPISVVSMAEREYTQHRGSGDIAGAGGSENGKSSADVLYDLSDEVILMIEPDYSKEAQTDALSNLEEVEIESDEEWDVDDEDVVAEFPKGDGEGVYKLEDGESFEAPAFEAAF
ncbi:hypothetical protein L1987_65128 [Smallanthus sonchifolius]|uniref:Uncharacterized protein n=1 Tax=Smallanthus sonchifolius TaxID=185202 RepID=A0ACB9BTG7_9ASTR|nr:hypothetical protein L1987_65128 [Smallanthus sonchifolius]